MRSMILAALALTTCVGSALGYDDSPAEQLQGLRQELISARAESKDARAGTRTDGELAAVNAAYVACANSIADRALDLAQTHPADPAAFDALIFVVEKVRYGAGRAMQALARDFIASPRLIEACRAADDLPFSDFEAAELLLRAIAERGPDQRAQGFAHYYLAKHLKQRAEMVRDFAAFPTKAEPFRQAYRFGAEEFARYRSRAAGDLEAEASALYETTIARFGNLGTLRPVNLGQIAAGELFNLRHLTLGKLAPDIEGRDVDDQPFRLADYRGKVVVLTFSGNWCGPCRAMYPDERKLVERLKDKPFALLSVSSDPDKETLRKAIAEETITWRCWWDGGTSGPIDSRWGDRLLADHLCARPRRRDSRPRRPRRRAGCGGRPAPARPEGLTLPDQKENSLARPRAPFPEARSVGLGW